MRKPHWCEVHDGKVTRIFKNRKRACQSHVDEEFIRLVVYAVAVEQVRDEVFRHSEGHCQKCGNRITHVTMHMDERIARGEFDGRGWSGEISLDNSWALCHDCHLGPGGEHWNRRPRFDERS
jgi:5-methylcytosine-specific restriction endonuclease McrA